MLVDDEESAGALMVILIGAPVVGAAVLAALFVADACKYVWPSMVAKSVVSVLGVTADVAVNEAT